MRTYLRMLAKVRRPSSTPVGHDAEIRVEQDHVGRGLRDAGGAVDRKADVGGLQAGASLMPSPMKPTIAPRGLQRADQPRLLVGREAAEASTCAPARPAPRRSAVAMSAPDRTVSAARPTSPASRLTHDADRRRTGSSARRPRAASRATAAAAVALGGSAKAQSPRTQAGFVVRGSAAPRRPATTAKRPRAIAEALVRRVQRTRSSARAFCAAAARVTAPCAGASSCRRQNRLGRALDDQQRAFCGPLARTDPAGG